jgi:hypothetical protein
LRISGSAALTGIGLPHNQSLNRDVRPRSTGVRHQNEIFLGCLYIPAILRLI